MKYYCNCIHDYYINIEQDENGRDEIEIDDLAGSSNVINKLAVINNDNTYDMTLPFNNSKNQVIIVLLYKDKLMPFHCFLISLFIIYYYLQTTIDDCGIMLIPHEQHGTKIDKVLK